MRDKYLHTFSSDPLTTRNDLILIPISRSFVVNIEFRLSSSFSNHALLNILNPKRVMGVLLATSLLLSGSPVKAQEPSEQAIRQTIALFGSVPDVQVTRSSPAFTAAENLVNNFLTKLIGSDTKLIKTFFLDDLQTITKRGQTIEVKYSSGLSVTSDKLPSIWKEQLQKAIGDSGSGASLGAFNRKSAILLKVDPKEAELSADGVSFELSNVFLFFGGSLESPSAKLIRRDGVLGLEVGLLPRVAGGVFSGDKAVRFIPLSQFGAISTVATLNLPGNPGTPFSETPSVQVAPQTGLTLYVDASLGNDINIGTTDSPLRSISEAIRQSASGTRIVIAAGTYSAETFPLQPKSGTVLIGRGEVIVQGGGTEFVSRTFGKQHIAIVAPKEGSIENLTVTDTNGRGYGIWLESSNAMIKNCQFLNNGLDGVFVTGNSQGQILDNRFQGNKANAITTAGNAQPLLQGNTITANGTGITVAGRSRPFLNTNQIIENRDGVIVESEAFPRLRDNTIRKNQRYGLIGVGGAKVDIGEGSSSNNKITENATSDVRLLSRADAK